MVEDTKKETTKMKTDFKQKDTQTSKLSWLYFSPIALFLPTFVLLVLGLFDISGSTLQWLCAGGLDMVGVLLAAVVVASDSGDPYGY